MKTYIAILLTVTVGLVYADILNAQTLTRKLRSDTVTLWASATFKNLDEYKSEFTAENDKYHLTRKFDDQHVILNSEGKVVFNYKDFIITSQKVVENSQTKFFVVLIFWDIIVKEDVSTIIDISELEKVIAFLKNQNNIIALQNDDIVSFENFQILKSSGRFYISIKDPHYGDRLAEVLFSPDRNEFSLILSELIKAKESIGKV